MFGYACLIIAALLAAFSVKEYRIASYVVAIEFAGHKVVIDVLFNWLGLLNFWQVYFSYGVIQFVAIYILHKIQSHFFIMGLIAVNMVFNFYMSIIGQIAQESMVYYNKFIFFYERYPIFVGIIMILELLYLGWLNSYVSRSVRNKGVLGDNIVDRLLRLSCPRLSVGKV